MGRARHRAMRRVPSAAETSHSPHSDGSELTGKEKAGAVSAGFLYRRAML
jgi:hypothetical protein